MRKLLFLSRLALICNLLFLVCLMMQRMQGFEGNADINGVVIILGWFISPILNLVTCFSYGWIFTKQKAMVIPSWQVIANSFFLLLELFIHFILPS